MIKHSVEFLFRVASFRHTKKTNEKTPKRRQKDKKKKKKKKKRLTKGRNITPRKKIFFSSFPAEILSFRVTDFDFSRCIISSVRLASFRREKTKWHKLATILEAMATYGPQVKHDK